MAATKWCPLCKRNVSEKKDFNWLVFIFLCGVCYLPFYFLKKPVCSICGNENLEEAHREDLSPAPAETTKPEAAEENEKDME